MSATDLSLSGRHALVCGASSGIGKASALALAGQGASLTVLARSSDKLAALVPELMQAGAAAARYLAVDLEDEEVLAASIATLIQDAGAVHVLINNSGGPPSGPLLQASPDDFLKAFRRHLVAAHLLVQAVLPGMEAAGFGRIINVISTSVKEPIAGLGVSNTIRGAVAGWSKTLAKELPGGITVNNVLPGFTDTERLSALKEQMAQRRQCSPEEVEQGWVATVPEGRLGHPQELAAAVAFLASPAAAYIRGVSLAVDGGRLNSI